MAPAVFNVPSASSGSLSAALTAVATSTDNSNTIVLAPGTYQAVNQQIQVPAGDSLTILGDGPGVVITANQQGRVFEINGNVRLQDLTITGGKVQGVAGRPAPSIRFHWSRM